MRQAGLPTPYDKVQQAQQGLDRIQQMQSTLGLQHQQLMNAALEYAERQRKPAPPGIPGITPGTPITNAENFQAQLQQQRNVMAQGPPINVPQDVQNTTGLGPTAGLKTVNTASQITARTGGGFQLPVDATTARLTGVPEGTVLGKPGWALLNDKLKALGYKIQDMGFDGPTGGLQIVDRVGNKVSQVSPQSTTLARGRGYAEARAANTPFETVEPGTNIPTTISQAQAIKGGAPKVSITQQGKLGGQYALYHDAYGILDKIDNSIGSNPGQVNLDNKEVSARVTAGYAALKEPSAKGLTGEFLSNYLARQPINANLKPEERDLVLSMAQGKAAATGLRSILGQAGTNEMQQRLDSGLMPGGQTAGSIESVKQQTKAMRGLLGRFSVGLPQAGLNAPGTQSALPNSPANAPAGADPFAAFGGKKR